MPTEKKIYSCSYRLSFKSAEYRQYITDYISEKINLAIPASAVADAFWSAMRTNNGFRRSVLKALIAIIKKKKLTVFVFLLTFIYQANPLFNPEIFA